MKNMFSLKLAIFSLVSVFSVVGMEKDKPVLKGTLTLNPSGKVCYRPKSYHECELTNKGINSNLQEPLVPVFVKIKNNTMLWNMTTPVEISQYECELTGKEFSPGRALPDNSKTFPHSIPLSLLKDKKAGEVINLQIYGYAVNLTLTSDKSYNLNEESLTFQQELQKKLKKFIKQPTLYNYREYDSETQEYKDTDVIQELLDAKVIKQDGEIYIHGPNGYKPVQTKSSKKKINNEQTIENKPKTSWFSRLFGKRTMFAGIATAGIIGLSWLYYKIK